ncbi:hypothetical protein RP20_CCG016696 [Aedes albopictus]|nr:hypothetical protein RP20_CCG016696 [Aedes albopictus]
MATIETECDRKKEEETRKRLADFLEILQYNFRLIKNLLQIEQSNVDQIWTQSIRYELLTRSCPDSMPYPVDLVEEVKQECLEEMVRRLFATGNLVSEIVDSYNRIKNSFQALEKIAYRLDWTLQSPLIEGSNDQFPLATTLHLGYNICLQLESLVNEFQRAFNAIVLTESRSVDRFRLCLKIPEDFLFYVNKFLLDAQIKNE